MSTNNPASQDDATDNNRPNPFGVPGNLLAPLANCVQALAALLTFEQPLRTIVFAATLLLTTIGVLQATRRFPTWFVIGILVAIGIFIANEPAGRTWLTNWWSNTADNDKVAPNPLDPSKPLARFINVSVFLDGDADGFQSASEPSLPGVPIEVRDDVLTGWKMTLLNKTGMTGVQQVNLTNGGIIVIACGVSQLHYVPERHEKKTDPLIVYIGITTKAHKRSCS